MADFKPKVNFKTFRPIGDQILICSDEQEDRVGSIIIPDVAKTRTYMGLVIKVGDGEVLKDGTFKPCPVKEGDRVLFSKYAGTELDFDEEGRYILVKQSLIWAITNYKEDKNYSGLRESSQGYHPELPEDEGSKIGLSSKLPEMQGGRYYTDGLGDSRIAE